MCSVIVVAELLTVEEALHRVLERVPRLAAEPVPIGESAGRVLAEDASAVVDLPRFPSSAMDGFAGERRRAGEDVRERVLDGDGIGHGADGTHGVRSGA